MKSGLTCEVPWISRGREAESHGHLHQVGEGVGFHFLHHLASVRLHGDLANSHCKPTCLFNMPVTINFITSRSRGVSDV